MTLFSNHDKLNLIYKYEFNSLWEISIINSNKINKIYSDGYYLIMKSANNWTDYKINTYNVNFATSKHSKKIA